MELEHPMNPTRPWNFAVAKSSKLSAELHLSQRDRSPKPRIDPRSGVYPGMHGKNAINPEGVAQWDERRLSPPFMVPGLVGMIPRVGRSSYPNVRTNICGQCPASRSGWLPPYSIQHSRTAPFNAAVAGRKIAAENRDIIAKEMTPDQIAEAQKLAREWKPKRA
jgi:hypothetical protein